MAKVGQMADGVGGGELAELMGGGWGCVQVSGVRGPGVNELVDRVAAGEYARDGHDLYSSRWA